MVVVIITIVHVLMCLILIAIVLLQTGKGASMGAAFGGASQTLFGSAGPANFLNKITTIAAVVFMITSFTLTIISSRGTSTSSKMLNAPQTQQEQPIKQTTTPAAPGEKQSVPATTEEKSATESKPVEQAAPEKSGTPEAPK